ncbi:MAG: aminoacyl-tRNA hydrolase [Patescibacteria group bacterium]
MRLIVGLGNPGKEYERTRHNVGFWVVDRLAGDIDWQTSKHANALTSTIKISPSPSFEKRGISPFAKGDEGGFDQAILLKPLTFMNNSGTSVAYAIKKHDIAPTDLAVIHDDLDVPLGEVRIRIGGGTAGHNGVASVAYHLQTPEFWRIRIGIGPHQPEMIAKRTADTSGFVLSPFHPDERPVVEQVLDMVCSFLETNSHPWEPVTLRVNER